MLRVDGLVDIGSNLVNRDCCYCFSWLSTPDKYDNRRNMLVFMLVAVVSIAVFFIFFKHSSVPEYLNASFLLLYSCRS